MSPWTRDPEIELVVEGPSEYREGCDYAVREVDGDGEGTCSIAYVDGPEYASLFAMAPKMALLLKQIARRAFRDPAIEASSLLWEMNERANRL